MWDRAMKQLQLLLAIVPLLMLAIIPNVNAGGPRLDYGDDVTEEEADCWVDGYEDAKADKPFNKDRDHGCDEYYPDYTNGFNSGCIIDATQSSCDLLIRGEASYCSWHPDIAACMDFLHNAPNK
jgi:hypothetical protein